MINLLAKLALDASAFMRGLAVATDGAKKAGNIISKEVGNDFTKGLKRTIGAGAVAGAVINTFRNAQKAANMASYMGITAQEFQALEIITERFGETSKFTEEQIKDMTKALIESGQIPSESVLTIMAKQANQTEGALRELRATLSSTVNAFPWFWEKFSQGVANVASVKAAADARRAARAAGMSPAQADEVARRAFAESQQAAAAVGTNDTDPLAGMVPEPKGEGYATEDHMAKLGRDFYNRQKTPRMPITQRGGSLQSIGLGPGLGQFNLQKLMVDEQKKTTQAVRELRTVIVKKL